MRPVKLLGKYKNGNVNVTIYSDGTKIRETEDNEFKPEYPESFDLKITNKCYNNCSFCHEKSTPDGKHGNLFMSFFSGIQPYTEIAIGGGNPMEHPHLFTFLRQMKAKKVICNVTLRINDLLQNLNVIKRAILEELIMGVGVSISDSTPKGEIDLAQSVSPNVMFHLINGIHQNVVPYLVGKKVLLLGYKTFGNGETFKSNNSIEVESKINWWYENWQQVSKTFKVLALDNLAVKQLEVQKKLTQKEWDERFMGEDGSHTMYIDLVEEKFALNSTTYLDKRYDIKNSTLIDMFKVINGGLHEE